MTAPDDNLAPLGSSHAEIAAAHPNASGDQAPPVARTLRRLFLMLFLRGRTARGLNKQTAPKSVGRKLAASLLIYALVGFLVLPFRGQPVLTLSLWLHAMTFLFLAMFIAASAGEVLFNKEEADILLHRPITPRALLWAKISTLLQVSLWLAAALNIVGLWVGATTTNGGLPFAAIHLASTALEALFCTGFVVMVYQLCLRWFGRERLEGLMTTVQVIVAIAAVLAGQLVPQLVAKAGGLASFSAESWWFALLPPAWFAGLDDAVSGSRATASWILAAVSLVATTAVLWIAFDRLSGAYTTGLQMLGEAVSRPGRQRRRRWMAGLVNRPPLRWWLRDPVQRAAFLLTGAYLLRDRETKLRVYPGLAPMMVMPVIFLVKQNPGDVPEGGQQAGVGFIVGFVGSFLGLVPLLGLGLLQFSQQWRAADIFRVAPIQGPGPLCQGARRAVLFFLTLPIAIVFVLLVWVKQGDPATFALLLPGIIALPVYSMIPTIRGGAVPLSQPTEDAQSLGRGLLMIVVMIASFILAGLAAWSWTTGWFLWFVLGEAAITAVIGVLLHRSLTLVRWPSLE